MSKIDAVKSIKNDDRYCILNWAEGLMIRIIHLNSKSFDEVTLDLYMKLALYDVLFYPNTDSDLIIKRVVKALDRSSSFYKEVNDSEIHQKKDKSHEINPLNIFDNVYISIYE